MTRINEVHSTRLILSLSRGEWDDRKKQALEHGENKPVWYVAVMLVASILIWTLIFTILKALF